MAQMPKAAVAVWKLEAGIGPRRLIDVKFKRIELISLHTHPTRIKLFRAGSKNYN